MYNFYLFLILLTVGKCIKVYLRKDIYKTLLISEEVLLSGVLLLILFTIYYKFVDKGSFKKLFVLLKSNKNKICQKILLYDILLIAGILLGGYILINEKIIFGESLKIAGYLILMALVSCFYKNIFNMYYALGILLIIVGVIFLEYADK